MSQLGYDPLMPPRHDSIRTLSTIARILQKSKPEENPLAHIVTMVRDQMKVDVCSLYLLQDKDLTLVATDGLDPSSVGKVRMNIDEGLTGLAIEKLQPVIVNQASLHPRFKYFPETGEEKFDAFAAIPLMNREEVVGVLTIQAAAPRKFDPQEIEILELIAFQLAGVIQNLVALEILRVDRAPPKRTLHLQGIAVAPGFGIGTAFFLRPGISPVILPSQRPQSATPEKEWKKLSSAIRKTSQDLLRLEKKLQKKFSKRESDIFYSHRMILLDPTFVKRLKGFIHQGMSAVEAARDVIGDYIQEFEKVEDPHFRERAADLEDIRQRLLEHLLGAKRTNTQETGHGILVSETLVPSDTTRLNPEKVQAILTEKGGVTSHAAILARSLGIPAVMGIPHVISKIQPGDLLIVDGNTGSLYVNPAPEVLREYEKIQEEYADQIVHLQKLIGQPAVTQDGHRVHLEANIGLVSGLKKLREFGAEGIGLYRTEFPFIAQKKLLNEEEQIKVYRQIIQEVHGMPVIFRLLDAGGDKPIESLSLENEANPFLGYRSIRLSLSRPEILHTQLRALLRVSKDGPIRLLVPMISGVEEIVSVRKILEEVKKDLTQKKIAFDSSIPFGLLIEVPSAVWMAGRLVETCDFFSIGTNDLIQYTLAVDRNNAQVAQFFEPLHPAILQSIAHVVKIATAAGKPVSICGEIAGDPRIVPLLVGIGVTTLSMIPSTIPMVKNTIFGLNYRAAKKMADRMVLASTVEEAKGYLEAFRKETSNRGEKASVPSPRKVISI